MDKVNNNTRKQIQNMGPATSSLLREGERRKGSEIVVFYI